MRITVNKNIFLLIILAFILAINFTFFNINFIYADSNFNSRINNYINDFYVNIKDDVKNRSAGSEGEEFLANKLSDYMGENDYGCFNGATSYLQEFKLEGTKTSQNVVGWIDNGSDKYVVIGAHYDSVYIANKSYGYNDNFSGVVASLITAENLVSQDKFNVILVFFGAEEIGCVGSSYFAKNLPSQIRDNILLYVNFDSVGTGDYIYYYHTDFPTTYGSKIDSIYSTNNDIQKYGNQLYAPNANLNLNYTNIALDTDNSSFIKQAINSLSFFAGNLNTTNGLGFFEVAGHEKIMHNTDSKQTNDDVFGSEKYVNNINTVITATLNLLENDEFNANNFASGQIKTFLYSDWILKGSGVILICVLFGGYFLVYKIKNKNKNDK